MCTDSGRIDSVPNAVPETADHSFGSAFKIIRSGGDSSTQWTPSLINPFASLPNQQQQQQQRVDVVAASSCRVELQRQFDQSRSSSSSTPPSFVRHSDGAFPVRSSEIPALSSSSADLGSLLAWGRGPEQQQQAGSEMNNIPEPVSAAASAASPFIDFLGVGVV